LTVRCAFVHILYQQALYADVPPSRRAALGLALAQTLERHHGERGSSVAAELGYLYEVGRDLPQAARQFCTAARNAARVFAHREAIVLARHGLELVESLPEGPERMAIELPLQTTLGLQLQVTEGYATPGAERAYTRARDLCLLEPGKPSLFPVLWGLWLFHKVRSELPRAQEIADELQAQAQALHDPNLALQAHQALGLTALCRGRLTTAVTHVEQAAALYDPSRHSAHASLFGQDPGVICKAYGAVALWLLGFLDAARAQSDLAIHMSRELSPISQVVALHFAAVQYQLSGDLVRTQECAEASRDLSAEHGFSFWLAGSSVLRGWALAKQGQATEGIDMIRQGLRDWRATGSVTYETHFLGLLAEVLIEQGQFEEGQRVLDEALALVQKTDERFYEPELHRLRGAIAAGREDLERAEKDYRQALELARSQRAKSLELRAAADLERLGQASVCCNVPSPAS
jgi:predicted ATPase